MLSKLASYTLVGINATPVEVEVDVSFSSNPKTVLLRLAEAAVRERTHRVERAIINSGCRPVDRVMINLAPADLKKAASNPGQRIFESMKTVFTNDPPRST
jgi:magnesium chelatase family protein